MLEEDVQGDEQVEEALTPKDLNDAFKIELKDEEEEEKPNEEPKRTVKNFDGSEVARSLNTMLYIGLKQFTCPHKDSVPPHGHYDMQDVQEINLGGAVLNLIAYYVPDLKLNHPVMNVILRSVSLVLMVREKCWELKEQVQHKVQEIQDKFAGIKPEWRPNGE